MNNPIATQRLSTSESDLRHAASILRAGGIVAMPTETVYGLAADAADPRAVAKIYAAKGRPVFNPLIAHAASTADALQLGEFDATARALADAFWPGPLTLVVPASPHTSVCELARAGLSTVAIRVPSHQAARDLIRLAGVPLAAPSANRSGHVSPTSAEHVLADLDGRIDAVIEADPSNLGVESTIIACLDGQVRLLRPGALPREALARIVPQLSLPDQSATSAMPSAVRPVSPGLLESHYAPSLPVRLHASAPAAGEAFLAFGPVPRAPSEAAKIFQLSERRDLLEAAANLYAGLRRLDQSGADAIAVAVIPPEGLGEAINDRLRRAATRSSTEEQTDRV
jgi:L-threonylcarbamoyladenylate synthase